ncbi:hypothetical protein DSM43518_03760 [Mycobacterium marinum]|nr:hypothetical protein DSM43518_03760 [Mycobacterium marinum]RFZ06726.1 hypothetical protein DE4381_03163 [Mycobacterium marinum]RFZ17155.1 hypothetical protein VIMS_01862 [Mycobacterium marinum]RFZ19747.1 hypothetical protein DSM43519_03808 [Mycobacterium marinum]RFZ29515.1 hypothetical protein DSM44344_00897 [Mycobacterium marinum]
MGGGLIDVQRCWQQLMPHRFDHLDHPGHSGGRLRMTHVGLDRSQPQRRIRGVVATIGGQQGLGLNGIAQPGARTVGFHHIDVCARDSRIRQRRGDHSLLGGPTRGGQPIRSAVLVHRRTCQNRQYRLAGAAGVTETLQNQHSRALRKAGSIRRIGERLATPVGRQAPLPAEADENRRRGQDGGATRQSQVALAGAQRVGG